MMKKKMTVLLAALGVLCVLTGVFFLVKSRSAAYEESQKTSYDTLFDLTANKIARIEWETADGEKLAFARESGAWKYEYDETLSVDQEAVNLLSSGKYIRNALRPQVGVVVAGFFKNRFEGSKPLADIYAKNAYNYNIYRYEGNQHEIASSFVRSFPEQLRFLETNVMKGEKRIVDVSVSDPSIKVWNVNSTKELYKNN